MDKKRSEDDTYGSAKDFPASQSVRQNRFLLLTLLVVTYSLATLQFLRAYFIVDQPYLDAVRYEAGTERMPFQSRILMAFVMRHAAANRMLAAIAGRLRGPLHSPDVLAVLFVDILSLIIVAAVVRAFYRHLSPNGRLLWMPYSLVLWMAAETYVVRFQEAIYFPYDLLAVALFTLCIYLCYRERYLLLLPVFLLACFNRETVILIAPLVLVNIFLSNRRLSACWKELAVAAGMAGIWIGIHIYLSHLYINNATEQGLRIYQNLHFLSNPQTWPQIASACGFLLPIPFLFWRLLPESRLRGYALLIPLWIVIMFGVGLLPESRIFGELIGLLAVLCTIIFERGYNISSSQPGTDSIAN
jgi:hypothetical protein